MIFTSEIIEQSTTKWLDYITQPKNYQQYRIEFPEGMNKIPVMKQVRFYNNLSKSPEDVGEELMRLMIIKKPVKIFLEKEMIGNFTMNNESDPFDLFPFFELYPSALNALMEVCMGDFLGKYIPPLKNTQILEGQEKMSGT